MDLDKFTKQERQIMSLLATFDCNLSHVCRLMGVDKTYLKHNIRSVSYKIGFYDKEISSKQKLKELTDSYFRILFNEECARKLEREF